MSIETVTAGAACAATGVICVPLLLQVGIDPASGIGGFVGVVMIQTLIPTDEARSYKQLALVTIGSVLMASMLAPAVAPVVVRALSEWVGAETLRGLTAGVVGGFAQPIAIWAKKVALPGLLLRLKALVTLRNGKDG